MNYGEIVENMRDLGFSDDAEMEDFETVVPNSINRAITEINLSAFPIIGLYEFEQSGKDEGLLYYDISELTKDEDGNYTFLNFADIPVLYGDTSYKRFSDYDVEIDKILIIDGSIEGKFKVFYRKAHTPYTANTEADTPLELPLKAHALVPLLACFYLWLDDDQTKAVYYYNRYEQARDEIKQTEQQPRLKFRDGGI